MQLEVLTPDKLLYKGEVTQVILPGLDGSFGVLNAHAAMIAGLAKGVVTIQQDPGANKPDIVGDYEGELTGTHANDSEFTFEIDGGIMEVKNNKVIVLAE